MDVLLIQHKHTRFQDEKCDEKPWQMWALCLHYSAFRSIKKNRTSYLPLKSSRIKPNLSCSQPRGKRYFSVYSFVTKENECMSHLVLEEVDRSVSYWISISTFAILPNVQFIIVRISSESLEKTHETNDLFPRRNTWDSGKLLLSIWSQC